MSKYIVTLILFVFLLSACSSPTSMPVMKKVSSTIAISPSMTPEPTKTSTQTITLTSTQTTTPTPTPTFLLPIQRGTDFPELSLLSISAENARSIQLLGKSGEGIRLGSQVIDGGRIIVVGDTSGISYYDIPNNNLIHRLEINIASNINPGRIYGLEHSFTVTPNGQFILVIGESREFELWNKDGEKIISKFPEISDPINAQKISAAVAPDGSLIAVAGCVGFSSSTCHFSIVAVDSGETVFEGKGYYPSFSPDGRFFSIDFDKNIDVYTVMGWKRIVSLPEMVKKEYLNWKKVFSDDGSLMAIVDVDSITIWGIENRKLVRSITGMEDINNLSSDTHDVGFTPDNQFLMIAPLNAWSTQTESQVVNISTGETTKTLLKVDDNNYAFWMDQVYWIRNDGTIANSKIPGRQPDYQFYYGGLNRFSLTVEEDFSFSGVQYGFDADNYTYIIEIVCNFAGCMEETQFENATDTIRTLAGEIYSLQRSGEELVLIRGNELIGSIRGGLSTRIQAVTNRTILIESWIGMNSLSQVIDLKNGRAIRWWNNSIENPVLWEHGYIFLLEPTGVRRNINDYQLIVYNDETNQILYQKTGYGTIIPIETNKEILLAYTGQLDELCIDHIFWEDTSKNFSNCFEKELMDQVYYSYSIETGSYSHVTNLAVFGLMNGSVYLYDPVKARIVYSWIAHQDSMGIIAFSIDGTKLVTFGFDGFIKIWGIQSE